MENILQYSEILQDNTYDDVENCYFIRHRILLYCNAIYSHVMVNGDLIALTRLYVDTFTP